MRIEIAAALQRDIPVIPVLIDGAEMPAEADLPEDLASLARRHALELRHTRFASDADAVVTALYTVLPKAKKSWTLPLAAAAVVALILVGGALWWFARSTPATQTAETPLRRPRHLSYHPCRSSRRLLCRVRVDYGSGLLDKNSGQFPPIFQPSRHRPSALQANIFPAFTVALGDSFDRVAAAYPSARHTTGSEKPAVWAQSDGLHFFFTSDNVLDKISLEPPYAGSVHGISSGIRSRT